jgi:hypothetical protein
MIGTPSDLSVVAFPAKFSINNFRHRDIVATGTHFENFGVAYIASKTETVKPMWKNHWSHSLMFGVPVKHHVRIFTS